LNENVSPLLQVFPSSNENGPLWGKLHHRRITVSGTYDFEHEMVLRNRRYESFPGVYAITPLKIDGRDDYILVSRGFVPLHLSSREIRKKFQRNEKAIFTGLVKESSPQKAFSPNDPETGPDKPWVDAWLRIDIQKMAKQLPYKVLPLFLEVMETPEVKGVEEKIVTSKSGRDDMLIFPGPESKIKSEKDVPDLNYPLPVFDTVVPPGRHQGYIFEWAFMAFMTFLIGILLQLRRPTAKRSTF